jgi:uncharacterized delta-60 repeat protein
MNSPQCILFPPLNRPARSRPHLHRRLTAPLLGAVLTLLPGAARAEPLVQAWVQRYNGMACAVAVDANGNVFVTGSAAGPYLNSDFATIKYSSSGAPLWTNLYNGPGNGDDQVAALALDTDGNVLVTGYCIVSTCPQTYEYLTIKYSNAGKPLWTNRYCEPGHSYAAAYAVAVDVHGDVFVTGYAQGIEGYYGYATLKYSSTGVPLWTNRYCGAGNSDYATALVVDPGGDVIVTGSSLGSNGYKDYATIKYSNTGLPLWTNRYHGPGNGDDYAVALACDPRGRLFVTGCSYGTTTISEYATVAYSSAGSPLWTNRYKEPGTSQTFASSVAADSEGNVFVTGRSWGNRGGDYHTDYATIKYSAAGVGLWTNRYDGPGRYWDEAKAVAVDADGNVFVTGGSVASGTDWDYATVTYSSAGLPLATNRYCTGPGMGDDVAMDVTVDASGNVYVTGRSAGDFATIKYVRPPPVSLLITNALCAGTNFLLAGTGGTAGATYAVLASTNPVDPLTNWVAVATNKFKSDGTFCVTNPLDATRPHYFFRVAAP